MLTLEQRIDRLERLTGINTTFPQHFLDEMGIKKGDYIERYHPYLSYDELEKGIIENYFNKIDRAQE